MTTTEIDDIFSGLSNYSTSKAKAKAKGKDRAKEDRGDVSTGSAKKKAKKRKRELERNGHDVIDTPNSASTSTKSKSTSIGKDEGLDAGEEKKKSKRSRIVETVQDPSSAILPSTTTTLPTTSTKSSKLKEKLKSKNKPSKEEKKMDDALERFKDSRGTGPRKRTEEGFLVYKEDELGIRDSGGDSPLCPFDCGCCF